MCWSAFVAVAAFLSPPLPIPVDAPIVLMIAGRADVTQHLNALMSIVDPPQAKAVLAQWTKSFQDRFAGRKLDCIDATRPTYVVFASLDGLTTGTPPLVWLFPCTDYRAFQRDALTVDERRDWSPGKGEPDQSDGNFFLDLTQLGYVGFTENEAAAQWFHRKVGERALLRPRGFIGADAAAYFNLQLIEATAGETLRGTIHLGLLALRFGGGGFVPGFDRGQLQSVQHIADALLQILKDGDAAAIAAKLSPQGAELTGTIEFRPGSPCDKNLADAKPSDLKELLKLLPPGGTTYYAARSPAPITKLLRRMNPEFEATSEERRAAADVIAYEDRIAAETETGVATLSRAGATLTIRPHPHDAGKLTEATIRGLSAIGRLGRFRNLPLTTAPIAAFAFEENGWKLHVAPVRIDLEAAVAGVRDPNLREATLESIRGIVDERTSIFFGDDGKRFIRIDGPNQEANLKLRKEFDGTFEPDPHVIALEMPKLTHLYAVDAAAAFDVVGTYLTNVGGALPAVPGVVLPDYRAAKNPPRSLVAFGLQLTPGRAEFRLHLPAAAIKLARESFAMPE